MDVTRTTVEAPVGLPAAARQVVADYVALTKPKVQSLLLFTTVTTMLVAGDPSLGLIALTCLGGYLSAGGAGAVNHWYDRDVDARMKRTADRPVASGRVAPAAALVYGCVLSALSFLLLALTVNLLAAVLALAGFVGYTLMYTVWLKRRTWQNIVWGGAAGAVPPLVGWAAVTGGLDGTAVYLFAIVFFWTPPHFWALSLLMKDEYAKVGIPMLPVVRGEAETRRQILLYTLLLYAVTQLPFCAGGFGAIYLVASLGLGGAFIAGAVLLQRRADRRSALRLYLFSLAYLALLFGAMVADVHLEETDGSKHRAQERPLRPHRHRRLLLHVRHHVRGRCPLHRLMSSIDPEVPPTGEEIHLPGPSLDPLLLTVGITVALLGVTSSMFMVVVGVLLSLVVTVRWIRQARDDIDELPLEPHH